MKPILIENIRKFKDSRGSFYESYKKSDLSSLGIDVDFVQDNQSTSRKNVIRGLHYQWDKPMGKLVRVSKGEILDAVVDIRATSPNFGQVYLFFLSEDNLNQLWVPPGFAHGFSVLSHEATVHYKCSSEYNKNGESGINPLDDTLKINWMVDYKNIIISDKDELSQSFLFYTDNPKF